MTSGMRTGWVRFLVVVAVVAVLCPLAMAGDQAAKPAPETVEMFAAIDAGQIGVQLIPKDSTQCRVLIENKTKKPLTVRLPDAFAGVPVLGQAGLGGMGGGGLGGGLGGGMGGGRTGGGGMQAMGGGMGGMGGGMMGGMGGMGGGMGGGFFNVAPEKVGKFKLTTVCLEHGKDEPRAAMKYEIKPITEFTDRVEVHEICRLVGAGKLPQRVGQAATWHLANDMSWQELASKQLRFANGTRAPYFQPSEIRAAMQASAVATQLAKSRKKETSPGSMDSLSQR